MYVITGATGNTGNIAARKLLADGQKVRVIGRSAKNLQLPEALGAEPFVCDLTNTDSFKSSDFSLTLVFLFFSDISFILLSTI